MMPVDIPFEFGEWLPDQPAFGNPGITEAKNTIPAGIGYMQLRDVQSFSDALNAACLGSYWMQDVGGTVHNFAGSVADLYKLASGDTWSDVTRVSGGDYTATNWEFEKWGDRVIAVNVADDPQYYDVGVSSNFALLPGSPPKAAHIGVVRDFIVLGNLDVSGTQYPNRLQWGGYNSSEIWGSELATQTDFQDLYGKGGAIQRIVPGEIGVIFQEHSIRRMTYEGPPRIFRIDEVERGRGTPASSSVVWMGTNIFYYGQDGFHRLAAEGGDPQPIGAEKVDRWFEANASQTNLPDMRGAIDRRNRLVVWAFRSSSGSTLNDRVLIYSWVTNRWSWGEIETEHLGEYVSPGFTLDGLDTPLPAGIDSDSIPVDSAAYQGGNLPTLLAFDSTHAAGTLSGSPLVATIDTQEISDRQMLNLRGCRPHIEGASAVITCQVGSRDKMNSSYSFGTEESENDLGEFSLRSNERYSRLRFNITGGFDKAVGGNAYGRKGARK